MGQREASQAVEPISRSLDPLMKRGLACGTRKLLHSKVLEGGKELDMARQVNEPESGRAEARKETRFVRVQSKLRSQGKGLSGLPDAEGHGRAGEGVSPKPGSKISNIPARVGGPCGLTPPG